MLKAQLEVREAQLAVSRESLASAKQATASFNEEFVKSLGNPVETPGSIEASDADDDYEASV